LETFQTGRDRKGGAFTQRGLKKELGKKKAEGQGSARTKKKGKKKHATRFPTAHQKLNQYTISKEKGHHRKKVGWQTKDVRGNQKNHQAWGGIKSLSNRPRTGERKKRYMKGGPDSQGVTYRSGRWYTERTTNEPGPKEVVQNPKKNQKWEGA